MTRPPRLTGKEIIIALRDAGFEVGRIKGSHHFLKHPDGRVTVIPVDSGEIIGSGLMAKILLDCDLSHEEFQQLL
jgi:predicted RNA binding protein YcfA (HicA-like mRNA interferase family)